MVNHYAKFKPLSFTRLEVLEIQLLKQYTETVPRRYSLTQAFLKV